VCMGAKLDMKSLSLMRGAELLNEEIGKLLGHENVIVNKEI
jgi:hypothetical protein